MEQVYERKEQNVLLRPVGRVRSSDWDDDVNKTACHGGGVAAPVWNEIKSR
jgi:hypothetical protein